MTEDEKMQVAVFRFSMISDFVNGTQLNRAQRRCLMHDKCARKWQIPFSEKTRISKGTVKRWMRLYKNSNNDLKALYPKDRSDQGKTRAMDKETCLALVELRTQMPTLPVIKIIEEMQVQKRVLIPTIN